MAESNTTSTGRLDYTRHQKVLMAEPIETTMSVDNPSYSNISEL